jgi:uncharacterized heparinase superfamily protein
MTGPDRFVFLGAERAVPAATDWNRHDWPKLWLYNLHYFDDLNAADAACRRPMQCELIDRWIRENPPGHGNGWEPYCLSRRIVAWVKAFSAGFAPRQHWVQSLAIQARFLRRRIEWHLLGNHLFENARALIFAGIYFAGPEAEGWLTLGRRILAREMGEQTLPDGGHFELSPMYHAIVLEGVLDVLNIAASRPGVLPIAERDALQGHASAMLRWFGAMTHPDGEIALFGDSAFGIAPHPAEVFAYASRLGVAAAPALAPTRVTGRVRALHLQASGYVRVQAGDAVALLDVGEIGPSYLPAHGHADALGFELSVGTQRVIVDSGTSLYAPGAERLRQRGTAAHSTVEIDGANSSEVWSAFRVARRAHPLGPSLGVDGDSVVVEAGHDGYRRLPGRPTPWRTWRVEADGMTIADRIDGTFRCAWSRLFLHPSIQVERVDARHVVLRLPGGQLIHLAASHRLDVLDGTWHPRFGSSEPTHVLVQACEGSRAGFRIDWGGTGTAAPPSFSFEPTASRG